MKTHLLQKYQIHILGNKIRLLYKKIIIGIMFFTLNFYALNTADSFSKMNDSSLYRVQLNGLPNTLDEFVISYQEGSTNRFVM